MSRHLAFHQVSFRYDALDVALFTRLTLSFPPGWTGVVGANGSGKTTLLRLAVGELLPAQGSVHRPARVVHCPQRTDDPPPQLAEFLASDAPPARELRGRLEVGAGYLSRWETLSHGERKRTQLAVALWQEPAVLAVDEPSNHIDARARDLLVQRLRDYPGIGLLVSHDRAMLDGLCRACLFVDPPQAILRPGNYTAAAAQHQADQEHARALRDQAGREVRRLRREVVHRREVAAREHLDRSKRGLAPRDHDAREKINCARVADSGAGAPLRQLRGRMAQATEQLANLTVKKEHRLGIFLPDCRSRRDTLFRLAAGRIVVGDRTLEHPELVMRPSDRIALTGANGAGKSTLVRRILSQVILPAERVLTVPQEIPAGRAAELLQAVRQLRSERLGAVMNVIARLGSAPDRVLQTSQPSPGEARKLMLALGIAREAHLIVMDEPTNHLDLPSIRCLEEALAPCPGGLLLVSHDLPFLENLTTERWDIQPAPGSSGDGRLRTGLRW